MASARQTEQKQTQKMDSDDDLHSNLVRWITQEGGSVHRGLALHSPAGPRPNSTHRGIFAKHGPVAKGETLIRLPRRLALDGSRFPSRYDFLRDGAGPETRSASPWLRCLAALMHAWRRPQPQHSREGTEPTTPHGPYLASLPEDYDSLLNWTVWEIRSFLAGTSLGLAAQHDACSATGPEEVEEADDRSGQNLTTGGNVKGALQERFLRTVVPYLEFLRDSGFFDEEDNGNAAGASINGRGAKIGASCEATPPKRQKVVTEKLDNSGHKTSNGIEHSYPLFRRGCMCLSTRAFHMQSPTAIESTNTKDMNSDANLSYDGPFLLPYIDLLNHAPRGSPKHVTTLRRDPDGFFTMVAERNIAMGEEICHSYDSGAAADNVDVTSQKASATNEGMANEDSTSLNSAQLLHTFGFVGFDKAQHISDYYLQQGRFAIRNATPAVLTKREISEACQKLASSSYPSALRKLMDESGMLDNGWEYWQMSTLGASSSRLDALTFLSEEIVIPFNASLSEELITICCLHFLPEDVFNELIDESLIDESTTKDGTRKGRPSLLLGNEVLDDYFLGKLVLKAVINALKGKLNGYKVSPAQLSQGCRQSKNPRKFLDLLGNLYKFESDSQTGAAVCLGENEIIDARVLSKIAPLQDEVTGDFVQKFTCGMVISLEERACLLDLKQKTFDLLSKLDD